jgi:hypothetical protein
MNLRVGEAAKRLGVTVKTLQRWDKEGVFIALRSPTNQRYYTEEQIENFHYVEPKKEFIPYYTAYIGESEFDFTKLKNAKISEKYDCIITDNKEELEKIEGLYIQDFERFLYSYMGDDTHAISLDHMYIDSEELYPMMLKMYENGEFQLSNKDWIEDVKLLEFKAGEKLVNYYCEKIKQDFYEMKLDKQAVK